ncbi:MAG: rhomboid family intramembrane serine protease [Luteolibacter sp.]
MTDTPEISDDAPVWARPDAFPDAPQGWGWTDRKGGLHPVSSLEELSNSIREDRSSAIDLVWTPAQTRMVVPEEEPALFHALFAARRRWAAADLEHSTGQMKLFGAGVVVTAAMALWKDQPLLKSTNLGMALVLFVMFALIPWYQAWKRGRELHHWTPDGMAAAIPPLRFETWLDLQRAPFTRLLLGLMVATGLAQLFSTGSIPAAGLVKSAYFHGESWRLLTAPFLHGNPVHWFLNMAALLYLGRRVEVFARWPHLVMVFLFTAWIGGEASARFFDSTSVGASGGLMGLLGFLLVFETLHARLVPRTSRRRLLAGVVLTGVIGVIGYRFIDNAAHAGGLIAGMAYAAIVFPKSSSPHRPQSTLTDRVAGTLALVATIGSAAFTVWKVMGGKG